MADTIVASEPACSEQVALHEAGHVVVAHAVGALLTEPRVYFTQPKRGYYQRQVDHRVAMATGDSQGRAWTAPYRKRSRRDPRTNIATWVAGVAAEHVILGVDVATAWRDGGRRDWRYLAKLCFGRARRWLGRGHREIIALWGLGLWIPGDRCAEETASDLGKVLDRFDDDYAAGWELARTTIHERRSAVEAVADHLRQHGELLLEDAPGLLEAAP